MFDLLSKNFVMEVDPPLSEQNAVKQEDESKEENEPALEVVDENETRFLVELEFVQSLSNPDYLRCNLVSGNP